MKKLLLAATVTCVLTAHALAGEIPSVNAPAPPTGPNGITTESAPGDMPISGIADQLSSEAISGLISLLTSLTV